MKYSQQGGRWEVYYLDTSLGSMPWIYFNFRGRKTLMNYGERTQIAGGLLGIL